MEIRQSICGGMTDQSGLAVPHDLIPGTASKCLPWPFLIQPAPSLSNSSSTRSVECASVYTHILRSHIITAIGYQVHPCRWVNCHNRHPSQRDALVRRSPGWAPATGRPVRSIQSYAACSSVDREKPILQRLVSQCSRRSLVEMANLLDRRGNWLLVAGSSTQCRHCVSTARTATGLFAER